MPFRAARYLVGAGALLLVVFSCAERPKSAAPAALSPAAADVPEPTASAPVGPFPIPAEGVTDAVVDTSTETAKPRDAVVTIGACPNAELGAPRRFTIAHINDFQARYGERIDGKNRYGLVAGYLRGLKADVPSTIVLDAGDDYEKGSVAELRSNGESTRQMIQALPIDVRTIGNHDFAYGEEAVMRDVTQSSHPVLAANIVRRDGGANPFLPYVEVRVGCVKVGIVGIVTSSYGADDQPSRDPYDGVFVQRDAYADVLAREVTAHRGSVDVMVALTHVGFWGDINLAQRVPGIDLYFGGHSEERVMRPHGVGRPDGGRAYVMQAGHYAEAVGRADIVVDAKRGVVVERYDSVTVDAKLPYAADVAALASELEGDGSRVVATVPRERSRNGMAPLLFAAAQSELGVDALVVGRDAFWSGIPAGPLTLQRLYESVLVQREPSGTPGFTSLYVADVSSAELTALRGRVNQATHHMFAPARIEPDRRYKVALEKRATLYATRVFPGLGEMPASTYAGELIDVLERYARGRSARSLAFE